jgi:hypothetical protein
MEEEKGISIGFGAWESVLQKAHPDVALAKINNDLPFAHLINPKMLRRALF